MSFLRTSEAELPPYSSERTGRIMGASIIIMLASIALLHGTVLLLVVGAAGALVLGALLAHKRLGAVPIMVVGVCVALLLIVILSSVG